MTVLAINILLEPDGASVERAKVLNARLLASYPEGFALDQHHTPHITILQRFVPLSDLEAVVRSVREAVAQAQPLNWDSTATGTYALTHGDMGAMGIVIQPTDDWRRLQERIIKAVAPFAAEHGTAEAFAPRLDGGPISQPTVDYVNNFVGPRTGSNYNPHITVGIAQRTFLDTLRAEPFEPFPVRAQAVSLYQVGDYGVAQVKLHDIHRC
ncbi:MAG: 2'-5' RNA ligase family protein [Cyanobacteriota bacterium]|nr:2'-5' RNA ligase family protein [Cyanobacteriota bacterium]